MPMTGRPRHVAPLARFGPDQRACAADEDLPWRATRLRCAPPAALLLPAIMLGGTRRRDPHGFCQRADPETMMPQRRMIVAANMLEERGGGSPTLPPSTSLAPEARRHCRQDLAACEL